MGKKSFSIFQIHASSIQRKLYASTKAINIINGAIDVMCLQIKCSLA